VFRGQFATAFCAFTWMAGPLVGSTTGSVGVGTVK